MEEILASIRRIIEDSDHAEQSQAAKTPSTTEAPQAAAAEPAAEVNGTAEVTGDVEAFRSELSALEQETEPRDVPQPEAPAEMRSAPQFEEPPAREPNPEPEETHYVEPAQRVADEPVADAEPVAEYEAPARREPNYGPPQGSGDAGEVPGRTSILSETAGRQVAAAFEELQDAFASSQRRSFDEIAEELLRPMLQEWLDNNLPVLVERLVREEIERVARGSR
jgi:cell pole-organizing protein PopZ